MPSALLTVSPFTTILGFASFGSGRSISSFTAWPTIISVISCVLVSEVFRLPMNFPLFRISTQSEISSTSFSLCVMMMIAFPSFFMFRRTSKRRSVSWGVRTAVGSSRMRISALRYSIFTISTVCFCETDIS